MATFKDLQFEKKWGGVGANYTFNNGITLSVQAGTMNYSTPKEDLPSAGYYSSFEIAMWDKDGEWVTQDIVPGHNDDVVGYVSRENIDEIISLIESK